MLERYLNFLQLNEMKVMQQKDADIIKIRFENEISRKINNVEYITALFNIHPETTAEEFSDFAENLIKIDSSIQALQFADHTTAVKYVYPPKGNEVTISEPMILLDDPLRGMYVEVAIREERMTVQPPFELRQGGLGIVARKPIFINDEFYGLGIAVIKIQNILTNILNQNEISKYHMRLADENGSFFFDNCNDENCETEKLIIAERIINFDDTHWIMQIHANDLALNDRGLLRGIILFLTIFVLTLSLIMIYFFINRSKMLSSEVDKQMLKIQEAESRFSFLIENSKAGYFELSTNDEFIRVNKAWLEMHGYDSEEEVIGRHFSSTQVPKDLYSAEDVVDTIHKGGGEVDGEFSRLCKDGSVKYHTYTALPITKNGEYAGLVGLLFDITRLKEAEAEKDFLMKELNHRVKNNLLMISSLVALKDISLGDDVDLSDISNQIKSIQLIHEKLYRTGDVSNVSVSDYFGDLIKSIFSTFTSIPIQLKIEIDDIDLRVKDAVTVGLLINEIATNAIKHAYIGCNEGWFRIEFSLDSAANEYVLKLSNSGVVFPEDVKLDNPETLGLRLISKLTKQMYGAVQLQKKPETLFIIRFPV